MLRGGQFSVIITPFSWSILGYQNQLMRDEKKGVPFDVRLLA